jgi:hypothetical protein
MAAEERAREVETGLERVTVVVYRLGEEGIRESDWSGGGAESEASELAG